MNIDCPICKITIVIETHSKGEYYHVNPNDPMDGFLYNLVQCPECQRPKLTQRNRIFELGAFDFGRAIRLFPNSEFNINIEIPEISVSVESLVEYSTAIRALKLKNRPSAHLFIQHRCVVAYSVVSVHATGCNQNENKVPVSRRLNVVKIIRHMSLASSGRQ